MAIRIEWDEFEIALLIEACEEVLRKGKPKSEVVKTVSSNLRKRAISKNIAIDDVFRNENGIALQMQILKLENALLERLKESGLDFVRNGARNHIPGNISVSFKDADGEAILHRLDLMGICVSTGSACDSVSTQISHVLKAIKLKDNYARGTIRISFGKENTFEEANIIAESLIRILKK